MTPRDTATLFPHSKRFAWFNHAGVSPMPRPARDAIANFLRQQEEKGPWTDGYSPGVIREARAAAARLIGAEPREICVTKSTTQGLMIVANSLKWRRGSNLVTLAGEFAANVYPWLHAAELEGLEPRRVAPTAEGRYAIDDILARVDSMTQLVVVSWVQFSTGFRLDIKRLGQELRDRGVLFCVDGVQGVGAIPIDVRECEIDFLSAGAHKWMLGPEGAGFLYVREGVAERHCGPRMQGWLGVEDPDDYRDRVQRFSPDARRFEDGARNIMGLAAMTASLEMLRQQRSTSDTVPAGADRTGSEQAAIFGAILRLTSALAKGLGENGMKIASPMERIGERSGIICFEHPALPAAVVAGRLSERGVKCVARLGRVRVSPHYYNTLDDVERLLGEVANITSQ
jgi:cysteine desulfurase/selenocysteine lyase